MYDQVWHRRQLWIWTHLNMIFSVIQLHFLCLLYCMHLKACFHPVLFCTGLVRMAWSGNPWSAHFLFLLSNQQTAVFSFRVDGTDRTKSQGVLWILYNLWQEKVTSTIPWIDPQKSLFSKKKILVRNVEIMNTFLRICSGLCMQENLKYWNVAMFLMFLA